MILSFFPLVRALETAAVAVGDSALGAPAKGQQHPKHLTTKTLKHIAPPKHWVGLTIV